MRKTTDQEQEVLEFLNMLRDSGRHKHVWSRSIH
jgi:hypothetical protein